MGLHDRKIVWFFVRKKFSAGMVWLPLPRTLLLTQRRRRVWLPVPVAPTRNRRKRLLHPVPPRMTRKKAPAAHGARIEKAIGSLVFTRQCIRKCGNFVCVGDLLTVDSSEAAQNFSITERFAVSSAVDSISQPRVCMGTRGAATSKSLSFNHQRPFCMAKRGGVSASCKAKKKRVFHNSKHTVFGQLSRRKQSPKRSLSVKKIGCLCVTNLCITMTRFGPAPPFKLAYNGPVHASLQTKTAAPSLTKSLWSSGIRMSNLSEPSILVA